MKLQEKFFIVFIALVYLMGQWGCTTARYEYPKPEPLLEKYREQLGTIGVISVPEVPVIELDRPLPTTQAGVLTRMGQGAWKGAAKTGGWMREVCVEGWRAPGPGGPTLVIAAGLTAWCILALPIGILGGLGGFFYGALPSSYDYPAYVEETEAFIRDTLAKYPIQEKLQIFFLKEAVARTPQRFVVGPGKGAATAEGVVGQGVDTVLELSAQRMGFKRAEDRDGDMDPPMVLALVVRARLLQGTEKTVWYDQIFAYETESRLYTLWRYTWPETTFIQKQIEKSYQRLAEQMVEKLILPNPTSSPAKIDTSAFSTDTPLISQQSKSTH